MKNVVLQICEKLKKVAGEKVRTTNKTTKQEKVYQKQQRSKGGWSQEQSTQARQATYQESQYQKVVLLQVPHGIYHSQSSWLLHRQKTILNKNHLPYMLANTALQDDYSNIMNHYVKAILVKINDQNNDENKWYYNLAWPFLFFHFVMTMNWPGISPNYFNLYITTFTYLHPWIVTYTPSLIHTSATQVSPPPSLSSCKQQQKSSDIWFKWPSTTETTHSSIVAPMPKSFYCSWVTYIPPSMANYCVGGPISLSTMLIYHV